MTNKASGYTVAIRRGVKMSVDYNTIEASVEVIASGPDIETARTEASQAVAEILAGEIRSGLELIEQRKGIVLNNWRLFLDLPQVALRDKDEDGQWVDANFPPVK